MNGKDTYMSTQSPYTDTHLKVNSPVRFPCSIASMRLTDVNFSQDAPKAKATSRDERKRDDAELGEATMTNNSCSWLSQNNIRTSLRYRSIINFLTIL